MVDKGIEEVLKNYFMKTNFVNIQRLSWNLEEFLVLAIKGVLGIERIAIK